ncbi:MAG: dTDP-4-dehydrorhamnose reductase [Acidimicrobiia bacterium]|nr:dTDP-4-dehydrorhamnose reductase [Acidimicrobiia bacterium]
MRVLITGAAGQVGRELVERFEGYDLAAPDRSSLDIGDRDAVLGAVTTFEPDVVVNPAAFTAVDACETERDAAWRANALAVRHLAEGCRLVGAHLVHLSTDYVFDGTKPAPYVEWDLPAPASVYGASKLGGEQEAWAAPSTTVVRTSWVCGRYGSNMVKTIRRVAAANPELSFVDDQRGHPTLADDLARMVQKLAVQRLPGLFHVTNAGAVSWYEFARAVLEASGEDPDRVRPISTADLDPPRPAPRPANSVLDNAALRLSGIEPLGDFREALARTVAWLEAHG